MFERFKEITKKPETKTIRFSELSNGEAYSLLSSKVSTKEVFGVEWIKTQHKSDRHFFCSQFKSLIEGEEVYRTVLPRDIEYNVYTAICTKSSCFPFKLGYGKHIFNELERYLKINGEILFTQMILQKQDNTWQERLRQQYDDYLQGIDPHFVTSNKMLRGIQFGIVDFIKARENSWFEVSENISIEGVEQKLSEIGFKVCLRFVIYGSKEQITKQVRQIELILRDMDYANNWRLSKDGNRSESLNQILLRKFPLMQREQILSMSEVLPFFCAKDVLKEKPTALIVEQPQEVSVPIRLSFKLPSLSHLPKDKTIHSEQDLIRHENNINKTLTRINLIKDSERVKVTSVVEAATVRKITFQLPRGLNFSSFNESVVKDIRSNMSKNASISMGNEPNTVALSVPLEKRGKVYLRDLIETEEFKHFAKDNPLPMLTGIDENGNVIMVCLTKLPHLLGAGTTGSGKSVWLNCVLLTLLLTKTPDEIAIFIIDPKMVEFTNYVDFPHVKKVETDPQKSVELLASLTKEMDTRYALLAKSGCKNIKQYNSKSSTPLKYLVCIVDEYSDLVMQAEDVRDYVLRLGQKARACGIHLIVATQRPSVDVIDGTIKAQLPARIAFNCAAPQDYRTVLDKKPNFTLLGKGDGVCLGFDGIDGLTRFQGAMIADGDEATDKVVAAVLNEWRAIMKGADIKQEDLPEVKVKREPTQLERAKFLICEDGKVTQRSLQKSLGIKTEKIKEVFDELVDDGWLSEPDNIRSGYQVKVDAKEIESFGIWFRETFDSQFWGIRNDDSE